MTRRRIARRIPVAGGPALVTYRHEPSRWYLADATRTGALRPGRLAEPFRSYGAALVESHRIARTRPRAP